VSYSILTVRTSEHADGRLHPVVSDGRDLVVLEEGDGEVQRLSASAVHVGEAVAGGLRTLTHVSNVKLDLLVSESRVILACQKYEKGGGWVGFGAGAFVAVAANGASKALAAHRRRGKVLVGQVRYPWLRCVGFKPKLGWASSEQLRLGVSVPMSGGNQCQLLLDATLPKDVAAAKVAHAIVAHAARYRLEHSSVADDERQRYEELIDGPPLAPPEAKKFAVYQMPTYFPVAASTAYPETETPLAGAVSQ
jgi:hypothetical protein